MITTMNLIAAAIVVAILALITTGCETNRFNSSGFWQDQDRYHHPAAYGEGQ